MSKLIGVADNRGQWEYPGRCTMIESNRITATGKGEYQPIEVGNDADIRSRNRRIEIVLSPKLDELYNLIK